MISLNEDIVGGRNYSRFLLEHILAYSDGRIRVQSVTLLDQKMNLNFWQEKITEMKKRFLNCLTLNS